MSSTDTAGQGTLELLLILPLLYLLGWGAAYLHTILLQKSRLERTSWSYSVTLAHHKDAQADGANVKEDRDCSQEMYTLARSGRALPHSYKLIQMLHCSRELKLTAENLNTESIVSGDDFRKSKALKEAMWAEAMLKAGFQIPLRLLALPELASAAR